MADRKGINLPAMCPANAVDEPANPPVADSGPPDVDTLDAIRARLDAVAPEPWTPLGTGDAGGDHWFVIAGGEAILSVACNDGANEEQRQPLAEFVAHARTDIRVLLAEVIRMASDLSDVYCDLTNQRLSYPTYDVRTVISEMNGCIEEFVERGVREELAARSESRTIRTADELAALPPLTVIREVFRPSPSGHNYGAVWEQRFQGQKWVCIAGSTLDRQGPPSLPATVLWHPEDGAQ